MRLPADQRRQQLLDVARDVFAERGFHATSMDEIAEAAGVTKPVLYQHFPSKRSLYVELLTDTGDQLLAGADRRDAERRAGPRPRRERLPRVLPLRRRQPGRLPAAVQRVDPHRSRVRAHRRHGRAGRGRRHLRADRDPGIGRAAPRARQRARRHGRVGRPAHVATIRKRRSAWTPKTSRVGSPSSRGSACAACAAEEPSQLS